MMHMPSSSERGMCPVTKHCAGVDAFRITHRAIKRPAVMISAGFCHLLGDAIDQLTRSIKYPLAPFLCACGFMSTLIADQIVEAANHHPPDIPVLVR
jgi:hypothetical protein